MNAEIPSDFAPFVQRMIAERRFLTESDVLTEALRLLQARETLRQEVIKGFEQLDAGLGIDESVVFRHAEEKIQQVESQRSAAK
jgi:antitoxin ParD1/3/4